MTTPLPNTPVSPLRQKPIDDMNMRHFLVVMGGFLETDASDLTKLVPHPHDAFEIAYEAASSAASSGET